MDRLYNDFTGFLFKHHPELLVNSGIFQHTENWDRSGSLLIMHSEWVKYLLYLIPKFKNIAPFKELIAVCIEMGVFAEIFTMGDFKMTKGHFSCLDDLHIELIFKHCSTNLTEACYDALMGKDPDRLEGILLSRNIPFGAITKAMIEKHYSFGLRMVAIDSIEVRVHKLGIQGNYYVPDAFLFLLVNSDNIRKVRLLSLIQTSVNPLGQKSIPITFKDKLLMMQYIEYFAEIDTASGPVARNLADTPPPDYDDATIDQKILDNLGKVPLFLFQQNQIYLDYVVNAVLSIKDAVHLPKVPKRWIKKMVPIVRATYCNIISVKA